MLVYHLPYGWKTVFCLKSVGNRQYYLEIKKQVEEGTITIKDATNA